MFFDSFVLFFILNVLEKSGHTSQCYYLGMSPWFSKGKSDERSTLVSDSYGSSGWIQRRCPGNELTIAIVNNGHMINMQKVAEAYTKDTGVKLNWVSLEEGVLREQVTADTGTGGGQYDIINIGMRAPIWGAAG